MMARNMISRRFILSTSEALAAGGGCEDESREEAFAMEAKVVDGYWPKRAKEDVGGH